MSQTPHLYSPDTLPDAETLYADLLVAVRHEIQALPVQQVHLVGIHSGGAWLAQHISTHYAFTLDKEFLRKYYPVLRGASEFCQAVLVEDPKRMGHEKLEVFE